MKNTMTKSTIRILPYLMLAIMITLVSCKGPSGSDGAKGSKGDAGAIGPAGEDGSMIYADTGAPTASIGTEGDYYLDNSTGELYGPKDGSGWGSPNIVLMGDDGQDGSQIHSGTGAPDPAMGATGDFYLDKSSYDLFGPKTNSGWGMALNLKGADGNANVTRYLFRSHDYSGTTSSTILTIPSLSKVEMKESAWLVYLVKTSTGGNTDEIYYPLPGYAAAYSTDPVPVFYNLRFFYRNSPGRAEFQIRAEAGNTTAPKEFDRTEIVRIKATNTEDKTKRVGETTILPKDLDTSNYREVAKYYGFDNATGKVLKGN